MQPIKSIPLAMLAGLLAHGSLSADINFSDDFDNATWLAHVVTWPNVGGWRDLRKDEGPLTNGWGYVVSAWGGNAFGQLVREYTGASDNGVFTNDGGTTLGTGTGMVLSIRKANFVYLAFDLADVVDDSVTVKFDYWFTQAVVPLGNLNYGVFDTLPGAAGQANDWSPGVPYSTVAATQGGSGDVNLTVDVSGFTGPKFYVAIQKSGNSFDHVGIDNVSVTSGAPPEIKFTSIEHTGSTVVLNWVASGLPAGVDLWWTDVLTSGWIRIGPDNITETTYTDDGDGEPLGDIGFYLLVPTGEDPN